MVFYAYKLRDSYVNHMRESPGELIGTIRTRAAPALRDANDPWPFPGNAPSPE